MFYGDVGGGKARLTCAIRRLVCLEDLSPCASSPRWSAHAIAVCQNEHRLDRELAAIGKARLLISDEFGYMPIDVKAAVCGYLDRRRRLSLSCRRRTANVDGCFGRAGLRIGRVRIGHLRARFAFS